MTWPKMLALSLVLVACTEQLVEAITGRGAGAMRGRSVMLVDRRLEVYKCPVWRSHPDQQRLFHIGHGKPRRRRG